MAIGKSKIPINISKLSINFGEIKVVEKGELLETYSEDTAKNYMMNSSIEINVTLNTGSKKFTAYTMDLTKKYIEINADYRT